MRYIIFILLLAACRPTYVFKESPCPTFEYKLKRDKKKPKKTIPIEKKQTLNPKFK